MFRFVFSLVFLALVACAKEPVSAPTDALVGAADTEVEFASIETGRAFLLQNDDYLKNLSLFDIQFRLKTDGAFAAQDLAQFQARSVEAWNESEINAVREAWRFVKANVETLELPLPRTVYFVKTNGLEEGHAAYTRGAAIFLPSSCLEATPERLQKLVAHELFHVMSRHDRRLRDSLYALIGFKPCNAVALPGAYASRRITNPDAPLADTYIEIEADGQTVAAVPVIFSNEERYIPDGNGTLFDYLVMRLMVVEKTGELWNAVLQDGQPVFIEAETNESFLRQIGGNTSYIIHPEETLADNFAHLVMNKQNLPNPELIEAMRKLLQ